MEIAIDFDGTCVEHKYPLVGEDIGAVPVLRELVLNNHRLILYTMRSGKELEDAVNWFKENEIALYGIQKNPTQHEWTESNKCYAQLYIDDAALGCPLTRNTCPECRGFTGTIECANCNEEKMVGRPFVYWKLVEEFLKQRGLIKHGYRPGKIVIHK